MLDFRNCSLQCAYVEQIASVVHGMESVTDLILASNPSLRGEAETWSEYLPKNAGHKGAGPFLLLTAIYRY